ncbi:MAG: hypothetical protein WBP45_14950 [Daejeonella sp.]
MDNIKDISLVISSSTVTPLNQSKDPIEIWKVLVTEEDQSENLSYCVKMASGIAFPVPVLVYRFKGNEIYPVLYGETLIEQNHNDIHLRFTLELKAKTCEEMLQKEYPDFNVVSITKVLFL